jgi:hypothetical protein
VEGPAVRQLSLGNVFRQRNHVLSAHPRRDENGSYSATTLHASAALPFVISTGANPDFLLRAAGDDHVCGSLVKRAACRSSKARSYTGNSGERSGEISVWMLSLGNVFRHSRRPYIFAGSAIAPTLGFLRLKNSSDDFTITYSTGMKIRFRTVDNNIPPTTVVPTERRPRAPAPVAK